MRKIPHDTRRRVTEFYKNKSVFSPPPSMLSAIADCTESPRHD